MLFAMGGLMNKTKFANNNETKITGEPGKQELLITRGFHAPRACLGHTTIQNLRTMAWATKTKDDN